MLCSCSAVRETDVGQTTFTFERAHGPSIFEKKKNKEIGGSRTKKMTELLFIVRQIPFAGTKAALQGSAMPTTLPYKPHR